MARPSLQPRPKKTTVSRLTAPPTGDVVALLRTAELPAIRIQQIRRRYGEPVDQTIRAHPYRLVHDIAGVSFAQADTLARRLGKGKGDRERVRAGIREILTPGISRGAYVSATAAGHQTRGPVTASAVEGRGRAMSAQCPGIGRYSDRRSAGQ